MTNENPKILSLLVNGAVLTRFVFSHLPRRMAVRCSWKNVGKVLALLKEMGVLPMASSLWWGGICPNCGLQAWCWSCGPPGSTLDVSLRQGLGAPWRCTSSHWLQRASSDQAPHILMVCGWEEFCFHQLGPDLQNRGIFTPLSRLKACIIWRTFRAAFENSLVSSQYYMHLLVSFLLSSFFLSFLYFFVCFKIWFKIIFPSMKQRAIFHLKRSIPNSIDTKTFPTWSFASLWALLWQYW